MIVSPFIENFSFAITKLDINRQYIKGTRLMAEIEAKENLDNYDKLRKERYDSKKKNPTFIIGDLVLWWKGKYPLLGQEK